MQVKKQPLELYMEQQTDSKLGKEYIKVVYCHLVYLTYMQSISCKIPGWMKHKLESRLSGEMSITSDTQIVRRNVNHLRYADDTILMAESEEN